MDGCMDSGRFSTGKLVREEVPPLTPAFLPDLTEALGKHRFRPVHDPTTAFPDAVLLLKRQTFNTNRAVVVVTPAQVPEDFGRYLGELRGPVAKHCRYIPFLWGIGIQVVVVAPGLVASPIDLMTHVDIIDNQWAIFQSIFLVDPKARTWRQGRTWGQFITGKFQDAIAGVLGRHFVEVSPQ
jgi:hypothetical protein